jgi:hypothetical protein
MSLDAVLQRAVTSVPECVAAGFVDLASGMVLSIKTVGPNVAAIEKVFRKSRGLPENNDQHYFQEIIVNSDNLIHVFLRGKRQLQVVCFVCRKGANLGMVLTKSRMALPDVENAL